MKKINLSKILLSAIEGYTYSFAIDKYSYTKPYKAFLDWVWGNNKINVKQRYNAKRILDKMIQNKLISLTKSGKLVLTEAGKNKLAGFDFRDFKISKPKVWDRKFRVIMFDIDVGRNNIRNKVRRQLANWGLVRVQNSVWVTPYECREVISMLKDHFGVNKNVIYMTVESIEGDRELARMFHLN